LELAPQNVEILQAVTDNHKLREVNKELFNKYPEFYQLVIQNWVNNPNNQVSITAFFWLFINTCG
jgi:hypothetical protein